MCLRETPLIVPPHALTLVNHGAGETCLGGGMKIDFKRNQGYTSTMKFIWDKRKNEANIEKHGLDFADVYKVFESPMLTGLDERKEYGEDRWIGIGLLDSNRVVVIVFTEPQEDTIRVISFRKATTEERKRYEQEFKNQFGSL